MAGLLTLPQPGDLVGEKYLVESIVDRCELGVVYAAHHAQTGRRFALRWLAGSGLDHHAPTAQLESQHTGRVVGCFQHSLVLSPIDFGRTRSARYLVMDWLEGETLSKRLERVSKLSLSDAARLLVPCMLGMHAAHLADVVHGELRPGNIFVCTAAHQPEVVRVFDYSVARPLQPVPFVDPSGQYTRYAYYLAPEQLTNGVFDRRSDVYAFGVILYRALTGRMPFSSDHGADFARWIYAQDPPPPPLAAGLTPAIHRMLMRAMARNPAERFDTCKDFVSSLETLVRQPLLAELNGSPAPGPAPRRQPLSRVATMRMPGVSMPPSQQPVAAASPGLEYMKTVRIPKVVQVLGVGAEPEQSAATAPVDSSTGASAQHVPAGHDAPEPPRRTPPPLAAEARELAGMSALDPQAYRRPFDVRLWWAAGCFALVGVVPLLAYYTPSVERSEARTNDVVMAPRRPVAPEVMTFVEPEPQLPSPGSDGVGVAADMEVFEAIRVPSSPSTRPPEAPRDDPDTLVDESDPLIAAALATIRGESAHAVPLSPEQAQSRRSLPRSPNDAQQAAKRLGGGIAAKAPPEPRVRPAAPVSRAATSAAPEPLRSVGVATVNVSAPAVQKIAEPQSNAAPAPVEPPSTSAATAPVKPAAATPESSASKSVQARRGDMSLF